MLMIWFIIASILIGLFLSYIWSSNGATNTLIKTAFTAYTLWAVIMLLVALAPMLSELGWGAVRLI